jgi:predicted transcriptional regulator
MIASLETLLESQGGWAPESFLYLPLSQALGINLDEWKELLGFMTAEGFVTQENDTVKITDKGRDMSRKFGEARKVKEVA